MPLWPQLLTVQGVLEALRFSGGMVGTNYSAACYSHDPHTLTLLALSLGLRTCKATQATPGAFAKAPKKIFAASAADPADLPQHRVLWHSRKHRHHETMPCR